MAQAYVEWCGAVLPVCARAPPARCEELRHFSSSRLLSKCVSSPDTPATCSLRRPSCRVPNLKYLFRRLRNLPVELLRWVAEAMNARQPMLPTPNLTDRRQQSSKPLSSLSSPLSRRSAASGFASCPIVTPSSPVLSWAWHSSLGLGDHGLVQYVCLRKGFGVVARRAVGDEAELTSILYTSERPGAMPLGASSRVSMATEASTPPDTSRLGRTKTFGTVYGGNQAVWPISNPSTDLAPQHHANHDTLDASRIDSVFVHTEGNSAHGTSPGTPALHQRTNSAPDMEHLLERSATTSPMPPASRRRQKTCVFLDCPNKAVGKGLCRTHGGGRRCHFTGGCTKSAQSRSMFCWAHGGGPRCEAEGCMRARKSKRFCVAHLHLDSRTSGSLSGASTPSLPGAMASARDLCSAHRRHTLSPPPRNHIYNWKSYRQPLPCLGEALSAASLPFSSELPALSGKAARLGDNE